MVTVLGYVHWSGCPVPGLAACQAAPCLIGNDIGQQRQMTRALDFTRQFSLAARAIAGLTPRLDLAALADITGEHIEIFVIEASAFRAIGGTAAPPPPAPPSLGAASPARRAILLGPGLSLRRSAFGVFTHESYSPSAANFTGGSYVKRDCD